MAWERIQAVSLKAEEENFPRTLERSKKLRYFSNPRSVIRDSLIGGPARIFLSTIFLPTTKCRSRGSNPCQSKEMHRLGTFEGRSTDWATAPRHETAKGALNILDNHLHHGPELNIKQQEGCTSGFWPEVRLLWPVQGLAVTRWSLISAWDFIETWFLSWCHLTEKKIAEFWFKTCQVSRKWNHLKLDS